MGFWKEYHWGEVPFSPHHIRGDLISTRHPRDVKFDHLVKVVFARFLHGKLLLFFFWCDSLSLAHSQGREGWSPTPGVGSIYIYCLEIFCKEGRLVPLPSCIYLSHCSRVSEWTHRDLFYTVGYNPILCALFCCPYWSSLGHWELFQLALVSPWHSTIFLFIEHFLPFWYPRCSKFILFSPLPQTWN